MCLYHPLTLTLITVNHQTHQYGGYVQTSEKYVRDIWSIKTAYDDTNTYADYMQFLYSVLGGKRFSITDYDNNDAVVNVKMTGKWGQDSTRRFNAGEFNYSFTVRGTDEIV